MAPRAVKTRRWSRHRSKAPSRRSRRSAARSRRLTSPPRATDTSRRRRVQGRPVRHAARQGLQDHQEGQRGL